MGNSSYSVFKWITNNHWMFGKTSTTTLSGACKCIIEADIWYHEMGWATSNNVKYTLYHTNITGHKLLNFPQVFLKTRMLPGNRAMV